MDRRFFLAGSGASAAATLLPASLLAQPGSRDGALYAAMDAIFREDVALHPQTATELGLDKGAYSAARTRLDERGRAGQARVARQRRAALATLTAVPEAGLSEPARLHRAIAIYLKEREVEPERFGVDSAQRPYPIFQQGGAYFEIPDFLDSVHPVVTTTDAEAYLARLAGFARALDQDTAFQQEQAARRYLAPGWSLDLTLGQLRKLRQPAPERSALVQSLVRRARDKGLPGEWEARAARIVRTEVYPALHRQIAVLEKLRPTTRPGDGFWRLPRGAELYAEALRTGTTTELSPEEVHRIGLQQVAELSGQLDAVLQQAGFGRGTVAERLQALNTAPDQLYAATDAGRAALIASLNQGVAGMWPRLATAFNDVPRLPLEIRRVPPEIQDGASNGYYYRAPLDGSRPAIYWINLKDVADWPKYQLPSLTYHEGIPGHHLQLSYVNRAGALPLLLRNVFISAYGEGWALYAEQLADELGGYTGIEKAGYLQSFLFRAARLVVDTGIHAKRWTRQEATDYMVRTTGFTRPRCQREVERYCTMAGQACSYKIGHNKWLELRERARKRLGAKFSLPWFHDVLKDGLMPLSLLEKRVDARIAERLAAG